MFYCEVVRYLCDSNERAGCRCVVTENEFQEMANSTKRLGFIDDTQGLMTYKGASTSLASKSPALESVMVHIFGDGF